MQKSLLIWIKEIVKKVYLFIYLFVKKSLNYCSFIIFIDTINIFHKII
jgi:hypothetical protein